MKKLCFGFSCVLMLILCGCQKNDCQTFLQGSWIAVYPGDSSYIIRDSTFFYQGDSVHEFYKFHAADTFRSYYSSYYIDDQCDQIGFNGVNTWDSLKTSFEYHIIKINGNDFQIINKADSLCGQPCIISFHR